MPGLFFDDLAVAQVFEAGPHTVERAEILDFARSFDPNPFHLDETAAKAAGLPDVIASGFHTLSLSFRLFFDLHLWDEAVLPSPGLNDVRFLKPLFPGDRISIRATVTDKVLSTSKPDRGIVTMRHETLLAETGETILSVEAMHRLRRRAGCGADPAERRKKA